MAPRIKVVVDRAAMQSLAGQEVFKRAKRVESQAKRLCPVDTGRLRSSISTELEPRGRVIVATVGTNVKYAELIHEGTGIYGPRGTPITPKRGRFLVFTPKGSSDVVFARSVSGVRPVPFLRNALVAGAG